MYYFRVYSPSDVRIDVRGTAANDYCARLYLDWIMQILIGLLGHVPADIVRAWSREDQSDSAVLQHLPHHPTTIQIARERNVS